MNKVSHLVELEFKQINYDNDLYFKVFELEDNRFCLYPYCDSSLKQFEINFFEKKIY
jgi:hypothetical protein